MRSAAQQIFNLLDGRERQRSWFLLGLIVLMAIMDTLGIASIMPFLAVLGNQKLVHANPVLSRLYDLGGFSSDYDFLFALGVGSLCAVLLSAGLRAFSTYTIFRFANMLRDSMARRLLEGYLRQPYEYFLSRNTADLSKRILSDVDQVVQQCLIPAMQVVGYLMVLALLIGVLFSVNFKMALAVSIGVGGAYFAVYRGSQRMIREISQDRLAANKERFTLASEVLGGVKEVKLLGSEEVYLKRFGGPSLRFARHQATNDALIQLPRFFIEAIGFGGVLSLALVMLRTNGSLGQLLPILGLYVFAGYRMLPAAQTVYFGLTSIRFNMPLVATLNHDFQMVGPDVGDRATNGRTVEALPLNGSIAFDRVTFRYETGVRPALTEVSFEIAANTTVGLVGPTGAGKTTVVDLILGLLPPSEGHLTIDGCELSKANLRGWQRSLGYVPQQIFLADASVAENIAFGVRSEDVDMGRIERAARSANIHDFIVGDLPRGYDTVVGERGVRLSGGQRQRIGIARALYNDPAVLVLDEATSALDNETEQSIIKAISRLQHDKTIIMIAHRLSTIRDCDQIIVLSGGRVDGIGTYNQLVESNAVFRQLAGRDAGHV